MSRVVPASDELMDLLEMLNRQFVATHERQPAPTDRLFDGAPPLERMEHWTVEAMKKAGVDPALIYAFEETGLMLNEQNEDLAPAKDVSDWDASIDEFEHKHGVKASRRRLTEKDLRAMLAHGPDSKHH